MRRSRVVRSFSQDIASKTRYGGAILSYLFLIYLFQTFVVIDDEKRGTRDEDFISFIEVRQSVARVVRNFIVVILTSRFHNIRLSPLFFRLSSAPYFPFLLSFQLTLKARND